MGQFALPLAILGVGVIGLWLLGPKRSSTSKPDSMPKLNSGLRGETMPVTFGTNRVSAHMVWSKNWTVDPQGGGGKGGKGGGSGGFGSAKGGGQQGGYNYKWDLIYHYGMFDVPSNLIRGWVGVDEIEPTVMSALSQGHSNTMSPYITSRLQSNNSATLSYIDAFIGNGYPTDSSELVNWPYFASREDSLTCSWPYTGWIGFNQLLLGQSPAVPQLFMEWGPINALGFTGGSGFLSKTTAISTSYSVNSNPMFVIDDDGKYYGVGSGSGLNSVAVHEVNGLTTTVISNATLIADQTALFPSYYGNGHLGAFPMGGKYFGVTYWISSGGGTNGIMGCIMYQVNTDGTVTRNGGFVFRSATVGNTGKWLRYPKASGILGSGRILLVTDDFSNEQPHLFLLPSVAAFLALNDTGSIEDNWDTRNCDIPSITGSYFMTPQSDRGIRSHVAAVIDDNAYFFFDKPEMEWQGSHGSGVGWNSYLSGLAASYPNGMVIKVNAGDFITTLTHLNQGPVNDFGVPMADSELQSDGTAGTAYDAYGPPAASGEGLTQVVINTRRYSDDNYLAKITAYTMYDGALLGSFQGSFSTASDFGNDVQEISASYPGDGNLYLRVSIGSEGTAWANFGALAATALDVTPAYIIYRILTHPAFGLQTSAAFGFAITEDRIDQDSYLRAVTECQSQGCYISVTYDQMGNVLSIIDDLLALYGGYLTENDGVISFGVVRDIDAPVRILDNGHFVVEKGKPPVKTNKAAAEDGYNKVSFTYLDREIDYGQNQVIVADEVDMDINGPRPKDWNTRYVMAGSLAHQIALRALWSNLYGKDTYEFTTGRKDFDLRPGDLVTLVDSYDTLLSSGVRARLLKRKVGRAPGEFKWDAIRDYRHINVATGQYSNVMSIAPGMSSIIETPVAPLWQTAYELPREFQGTDPAVYFAYGASFMTMGAQLHVSVDGATYLQRDDITPYCISGALAAALPDRPKGHVENDVEFYLFPTSGFSVATPTYVQTVALDDLTPSARRSGFTVLICGSEAIAAENATLLAQNRYRAKTLFRGWGGTPISQHNSGAYFHAHGDGVFEFPITQNEIGVTVSYKIVPYNFAGKTYDISSISANTYTIGGNYWLPRAQPFTRFWVQSAISWPASTPFKGTYIGVASGGCELVATWPLHDNVEGFGAGGFGAGSFGHFIMADSVAWRVNVYSGNGAAVSSFFVGTAYFKYTVAQNSQDFNGFARDFSLRVTPYTVKGEGPVTDVRSISMNW